MRFSQIFFPIRFVWSLPRTHPTVSAMLTLLGDIALITFASVIRSPEYRAQMTQDPLFAGNSLLILAVVILGLWIYAIISTKGFQYWEKPNGKYRHALIRYLGPLALLLPVFEINTALAILLIWSLSG